MDRTCTWHRRGSAALLALALVGCPAPVTPPPMVDAGRDAPLLVDGGPPPVDSGPDAGPPEVDAGPPDAPMPMDAGPPIVCTADGDCDDGDTCSGTETCGAGGFACVPGTGVAPGTACDADGVAATRDICLTAGCAATRCGDSFTDATALEQCDDGNGVDGDGCDDCRFTCSAASDCADTETCNGSEGCSASHVCTAGTNLANGTSCATSTGRCVGGSCLPNTCATAADCQDGDLCNGAEVCNATTGCGVAPAPTDCNDSDACTLDGCVVATGCTHTFIDADRDGHAPTSVGACGTDCDDTRADVSPDAGEICGNLRDDDCDGMVDEVGVTTWYADCDGDGFASMGARMLDSCSMPAVGLSMCTTGGGWTSRSPAMAGNRDCNDGNASVNPAQTAFQTTAISGAPATSDFDYDCNGTEERRVSTVGSCTRTGGSCVLVEGWQATAAVCGATGTWISSCTSSLLSCNTGTEMRQQACR